MPVSEPYPERFEIEIDRENQLKYMQNKAQHDWFLIASLLVGFISLMIILGDVTHNDSIVLAVKAIAKTLAGAGVSLFVITVGGYYLFSHKLVLKRAAFEKLEVDGADLVHTAIVKGDIQQIRRTHFRSITDFISEQDNHARKLGIGTIVVNTTGGGTAGSFSVVGIKDHEKVCKMLTEIDALREGRVAGS